MSDMYFFGAGNAHTLIEKHVLPQAKSSLWRHEKLHLIEAPWSDDEVIFDFDPAAPVHQARPEDLQPFANISALLLKDPGPPGNEKSTPGPMYDI